MSSNNDVTVKKEKISVRDSIILTNMAVLGLLDWTKNYSLKSVP